MAVREVNITVLNNAAGIPASADGVFGLICEGTTVSTTFVLGTAYLLSKEANLGEMGITAVNNPAIFQHVTEFYAQAGDGAKLWLLGVADPTAFKTYLATEAPKTFVRNSKNADPLNKIKGLFIGYNPPAADQSSTDFPSDVTDSIPILQTMIEELRDEGYYIFGVIDGKNMSKTVSFSGLGTMATKECPQVGICITGSDDNGISSIGLLAGKFARISVGTDPGKVKDGAIEASTMYVTNGITTTPPDDVKTLTKADIDDLAGKQFIFACQRDGKSGFYWNDGSTCDLASNSLSKINYNRIANKIASDARAFWTNELGDNVPVDNKGDLDGGYCSTKAAEFDATYINPLRVSGDISNASMSVSGVSFTANKTVNVSIKILPAPGIDVVEVTIEFVTSL